MSTSNTFKVGSRIKYIGSHEGLKNELGTIRRISEATGAILIEWDNHDICTYVSIEELVLL